MRRAAWICLLLLGCEAVPKKQTTPSDTTEFTGLFNFRHDPAKDRILLDITDLNEEFLYVHYLASGVGSNDIGLDRGQLGGTRVVRFERHGPKVLLVQPNYRYRARTDNADERLAVDEAFATSVLWGFKVEKQTGDGVVVDATDFFLRDVHDVSGSLKSGKQGSYKLDKTRSAFYLGRTRAFPDNIEIEVTLTFTGSPAGAWIRSVAPSPDSVTVRQHHSFVRLPDGDYEPRPADPRSGFFGISFFDYATPIGKPILKKYISRHRLKEGGSIVYYLDRGTPEPVRSALLDGARWWAAAFEAAGHPGAFRVEMLPEGADPLDVRYNVIQWVHRSTRGWSYGASVRDPRTGEIIKGHVTLGSLRVRQDYLIAQGLLSPFDGGEVPKSMQEMALARIRQLSAHEVGHTLGLAHNFAASGKNRASVMDYPHPLVKLKLGKIDLSEAYDDKIGAWDKLAIRYGYSETEDPQAVIQDGIRRGLVFMSDSDARSPGSAHPDAHLWDNGADPAAELVRVLKVREAALGRFGETSIPKGTPFSQLEEVLVPVYFFHRYQAEAAVKLIGGLFYTYAVRGDGQPTTRMVPGDHQKRALDALMKTLSADTLTLPEALLKKIPPRSYGQRRGREVLKLRTGPTFDPIGAAESAADHTVGLLLNPARASRLVEFSARNKGQLSLGKVLHELVDRTWKAEKKGGLAGEIRKVVQNVVLHHLMRLASNEAAASAVRAMALEQLEMLDRHLASADSTPHHKFARRQIDLFRKDPRSVKHMDPLPMPPGSPIGCGGWHD